MKYVTIETSGLKTEHGIMQITWEDVETGDRATVARKLAKNEEASEQALRINGLNPEAGVDPADFAKMVDFSSDTIIIHNGKFTLNFLDRAGIEWDNAIDVMAECKAKGMKWALASAAKEFGYDGPDKIDRLKAVANGLGLV